MPKLTIKFRDSEAVAKKQHDKKKSKNRTKEIANARNMKHNNFMVDNSSAHN